MTRHSYVLLTMLWIGSGVAEATDRPPGYVLQETIAVPVNGSVVTSSTVLLPGVTYTIRASGTFTVGGPGDGLGDAEYANFSDPPGSLQDVCGAGSFGEDLGIGINDTVNDARKSPYWGPYSPTHEYTAGVAGVGAPIRLNYHDCVYPDNRGSLTVEIFRQAGFTVELNQTVFRTGQTMVATACLSPGFASGTADAYVVLQLPTGAYYSLHGGGLVPGIRPFTSGFGWPPGSAASPLLCLELLRYTFTGVEPPGTYTWYSAGTTTGTLNLHGPLATQIFTFTP